ncbi:MAG TPA: hypothetical protein VN903_27040 [Polyangia bacterium]|nr:hypothetical protein [Polyangia bacterium]
MPKMISLVQHEYAQRVMQPDETFEAEDPHVQLLIALGRAELVNPGERSTRVMESSNASATRITSRRGQRRVS